MQELRDLYQEVIIEHGRHPRNYYKLEHANHSAKGYNPLCGDKITVYLHVSQDIIQDISFEGSGCAISMASASLMSEQLKGKSIDELNRIFALFHKAVTTDVSQTIENSQNLGKLQVLLGVREFPMRVKCATLAWHTLQNALKDSTQLTTTE